MSDEEPLPHLYEAQHLGTKALGRLGAALASGRKLTEPEDELYRFFSTDTMDRTTASTDALSAMLRAPLIGEVLPRVATSDVTGRPKTRRTLSEKLQRTPEVKLPSIHDSAGVRIVGRFSLFEQRRALEVVQTEFQRFASSRQSLVVDRLDDHPFGYRALHLVVWPEGRPVEIQIRTDLQHAWAELMEVLGDRWGREPRYGDPVTHEDDQERHRRQSVVDALINISADIEAFENASESAGLAHVHPPQGALTSAGIDMEAIARAQAIARDLQPEVESLKQNLLRALTRFGVDADLESDS